MGLNEYVDELIYQMNMIYNYLINDIDYTQSDSERWEKAKDLFLNPSEYLHGDGGVVYGILLNSRGGAVLNNYVLFQYTGDKGYKECDVVVMQ